MKMKTLLLTFVTTGVLILAGCGSSNDTDNTTKPIEEVTPSQYFNKIGANGTILEADATSWEMVELVEAGLLVNNPTFANSVKTYTFEEAVDYCENLSSAGYTDFRTPTENELLSILKTAILSDLERSYFQNYFQNYLIKTYPDVGARKYYGKLWFEKTDTHKTMQVMSSTQEGYNVGSWSVNIGAGTFCVRKW